MTSAARGSTPDEPTNEGDSPPDSSTSVMYGSMAKERYEELEISGEAPTEEEFNLGWHYCFEWDMLLIDATGPEWAACRCHTLECRAEIEANIKAAGLKVDCWPMKDEDESPR